MYRIVTTRIEFDLDRIEEERYVQKEAVFGFDELLIEESEYNRNGSLENRILFHYDKEKRNTGTIHYNSRNELVERHQFTYNESDLVTRIQIEYNNGSKYIKEISFTGLGFVDEVVITDENGVFQGREVYVVDAQGNVVEEIEMDELNMEVIRQKRRFHEEGYLLEESVFRNGEPDSRKVFEYDVDGNMNRMSDYDNENRLMQTTTYLFNANHDLIESRTRSDHNAYALIEKMEYDENHNMILCIGTSDGKLVFRNACTYENGKIVSEEIFQKELYRGVASHFKLIHEYKEGEAAR